MTVTTSTNKTQPLGNGVTTSFPYAFRIFAAADLVVVSTVIATGVDTTLVLGTDYTVTGAGSYNGGNVVFSVAPATGVRLTIRRVMSITQQTDLRNNGAYFAETHEDVFDKQTMVDQQLQEQFGRELLQPISDTAQIGQLPTAAARANKLFSYDANGNPIAIFPSSQTATDLQALLAASGGAAMIGWIQSGIGAIVRWVQDKLRDTVHVKDFLPAGYVTDASVDYTAYIQAAINELFSRGGGNLDMSGGRWLVDSANLIVKKGVCLRGPWKNAGEISTRNYLSFSGSIILNPLYTINLAEDFSAIKGLVIARKGLTIPTSLAEAVTHVAAFAGKAITVGDSTGVLSNIANDSYAGYCLILGFQYAYYNDFNERPRIEYLAGDNVNGVFLNQIYDMNHLRGCHFWPFTTTHQAWTLSGAAGYRRNGNGYYFGTGVDWGQAESCFAYGYDKGFSIAASDHVTLINCGADNLAAGGDTTTKGFYFGSTSKEATLIRCKAAAQGNGFHIATTSGLAVQGNIVTMIGCDMWGNLTNHCFVETGRLSISGSTFATAPTGAGLQIAPGSGGVVAVGNTFDGVTTPITATGAGLELSHFAANNYVNCVDATIGTRRLYNNQLAADYKTKYSADSNAMTSYVRKARGTASLPTVVGANENLYALVAQSYDGATFGSSAAISMRGRGAHSAGSTAGAVVFSTAPVGSSIPADRLIINEDGHVLPLANNTYTLGGAGFVWANNYAQQFRPGAGTAIWTSGAGTPEAVITAPVGSLYTNTSGGAGTTLYIKESGAGNTGWIPK